MPKGLRVTPKGLTAKGARVAVEAESYGETASGKVYNNLYHFLVEVREGKIQAVRAYIDTMHATTGPLESCLAISKTGQDPR
jgi:uncharacterized protein